MQQLAQAIHHTTVQYDIISHQNHRLEVAVAQKKQRQDPKKALYLEAGEYSGSAGWWSPKRIQRHWDRLEQERLDQEAEVQMKADKQATQVANRQLKARLVAESKTSRLAAWLKKQREMAAAKALKICNQNLAAMAKKQQQSKSRSKPKPASKPRPKMKPVVGAGASANAGAGAPAPPLPPPQIT
ncbi:hypothetical protein EJ02DRAFT_516576 [Clathrospora elynae]|uniref:Uncharacterized protein n=1 Tax=Clathrospora elynae TaxID=706981 RepID=A0A6A5S5L0_9PLEO|nr:hypothetical protein EJ02DRAFT_516576 [Clathrospora elynae]